MNCHRCGKQMRITNTYKVGDHSKTQRLECRCGAVATAVTIIRIVHKDPKYGQGAAKLAAQMRSTPQP